MALFGDFWSTLGDTGTLELGYGCWFGYDLVVQVRRSSSFDGSQCCVGGVANGVQLRRSGRLWEWVAALR